MVAEVSSNQADGFAVVPNLKRIGSLRQAIQLSEHPFRRQQPEQNRQHEPVVPDGHLLLL